MSRRIVLALATVLLAGRVAAEEVSVPVSLQVELLMKIASYDKNLRRRAGELLRVAVLVDSRDADSGRVGAQALAALAQADDVIGLPVEPLRVQYTDAAALARVTGERRIAVLYVTPGFAAAELDAISRALEGHSVLSAGALAKYTERGTVLGFDLVGGKPKLLVHLARARRQQVELSSAVLKLMTVIE
jgi:YfiR/HmsC-like